MISIGVTPSGDGIINGGTGILETATVNIRTADTITARPTYYTLLNDPPQTNFPVSVCQTDPSTGACMAPPSTSVTFTATPNVTMTFTVFVQAAQMDPGFDPGNRRMFLEFTEQPATNPAGLFSPFVAGGTSAAVRVH